MWPIKSTAELFGICEVSGVAKEKVSWSRVFYWLVGEKGETWICMSAVHRLTWRFNILTQLLVAEEFLSRKRVLFFCSAGLAAGTICNAGSGIWGYHLFLTPLVTGLRDCWG